ncbi:MAG TPA: amidohydrolase [Terriglobales bacterium]|nr:amidohydrolase [Terriglobales bacterium]
MPAPDAIYLHGNIATMDPVRPRASALAVNGDTLVAVGTDEEILALAGPRTERMDMRRQWILPGFHDVHTHQLESGLRHIQCDLSQARSLADFQRAVEVCAAKLAPGEWLLGSGWDHTLWPGQRFPSRYDLDRFIPDRPAFLMRGDVHAAVANSAAIRVAGVTRHTPNPSGGRIATDAQGEPTGMFFEDAKALIARVIPPLSPNRRRQALRLAMDDALRHGVTSIGDYSAWETFLAFEQMQSEGELKLRVNSWLDFNQPLDTLVSQRAHHPANDPWLHTGMLKGFMDGSLGSRTAAMLEPYADDPGNCGLPQYEQAELNEMAGERARAGFQFGFHAIGDRAVRMALNAFEVAQTPGQRHRIEHLQVVAPADVARMRALGVIASVQPSHLLSDARWAADRIGPERVAHSYPWSTFLKQGIVLAFGSDAPVEPISPFRGIYAAVTRAGAEGTTHYGNPAEALTLEQALYAYTMGPAIAEFAEATRGSLSVGKLADFVVLSQDLEQVPAQAILETQVQMTVVGGNVMWCGSGQ